MIDDIIKSEADVTDDMIGRVLNNLVLRGVHQFSIDEGRHYGVKRVVLATIEDSEEIMISLEGSGCIFLNRHSNINKFVFVTAGFQLTAAQILTKVCAGFAQARAEVDRNIEARYPQLTHQHRS